MITYRAESRTDTRRTKQMTLTAEMNMLKSILGKSADRQNTNHIATVMQYYRHCGL